MSAHRDPADELIADRAVRDPGASGTIQPIGSPAFCAVKTAAAESRVLARPTTIGQECTVILDTDGGDLTITQSGGGDIDVSGNDTATLSAPGEFVSFIAISVAGVLTWRVNGNDGAAFS